MTCLLALLALIFPRLTIILLWIFSSYIGDAFGGKVLWPILGFLFMPMTLLAYAFGINQNGSIDGIYLVLVIIAVLIDLGIIGGSAYGGEREFGGRRV
ncbi:MAG: hypothetical protein KF768_04835 [Phycisphaeraceae bacterium]|nr:hypothetical protein [Phycisphaeraceae bacterium]